MPTQLTLSDWIRRRRAELDLTQEALAEHVGCSVQTVRAFEQGRRRPSRYMAERIATMLRLPPQDRAVFLRAARARELPELQAVVIERPAPIDSLPQPITSFIGRTAELAQIEQLLCSGAHRLVTIIGLGGIGKTRLAIQAAARLRGQFADGAAFISLASVATAERIPEAIGAAIGLNFAGNTDTEAQLIRYLRERELLLVIDNIEHLLAGVDLLVHIVQTAPRIRLLVTSREPLHLQNEALIALHGLPIDTHAAAAPDDEGAVGLFVQRARRVQQGFEPTRTELEAVHTICRLVDGMPLALELAAAWVRSLSCSEIARELASGQELLVANARDLPERHRSLRAAFDHSWRLLAPIERQALSRLSIFRGSITREAAAAVLADIAGLSSIRVLQLLNELVDKSLLRVRRTPGRLSRYEMHELIRQYAADRLAEQPDEEQQTRTRHAAFFAGRVETLLPILESERQRDAQLQIVADIDNIRAAWRRGVQCRDTGLLMQMCYTLHWYYEVQCWYQEAAESYAQAADAFGPPEPDTPADIEHIYWIMFTHAVWFAQRRTPARCAAALTTILAPLRRFDDQRALCYALSALAYAQLLAGDAAGAEESAAAGLAAAERTGHAWFHALALNLYSAAIVVRGNFAAAQEHVHESLALSRQVGDPRLISFSLYYLGTVSLFLVQPERARYAYQECLNLSAAHHDRYMLCLALQGLSKVAQAQQDAPEALWLVRESLALAREIGDAALETRALTDLAALARADRLPDEARRYLREALAAARDVSVQIALDVLLAWCECELHTGREDAALIGLIYVSEHPQTQAATRAQAGQLREELAQRLGNDTAAAAQARARTLAPEHPERVPDI